MMLCFILLKSESFTVILGRYAPITSFVIGIELVMKFAIQGRSKRCFMRALRRNTEGDIDESLVPQSIRDWYDGTDDEEDTESEKEFDCEWD